MEFIAKELLKMINIVAGSVTSSEFLSIIPKKTKEDHDWDKKEMKRIAEQFKYCVLNPKMDLEHAIADTQLLMKKIFHG